MSKLDDTRQISTDHLIRDMSAIVHMKSLAELTSFEYLDLFEDEDEFEFSITNIDTDLLRVPQLLSYDDLATGQVNLYY